MALMVPRVVIPYAMPKGAASVDIVTGVLQSQGFDPERYLCIGGDGYFELMTKLWNDGREVVLVEHDVIPWPGAIAEMLACSGQWCSYPYLIGGKYSTTTTFGCTKFGARLIEETPWVWKHIGSMGATATHWSHLDGQFAELVKLNLGWEPHRHAPPVTHLNPKHYPTRVVNEGVGLAPSGS